MKKEEKYLKNKNLLLYDNIKISYYQSNKNLLLYGNIKLIYTFINYYLQTINFGNIVIKSYTNQIFFRFFFLSINVSC